MKIKKLTHTGIEYARGIDGRPGYGWNFYPGCRHVLTGVCPVGALCWAEGMSKRHKENFRQPRLVPERLLAPLSVKKPSTILVNFMGDLGGDWVDPYQQIGLRDGIDPYYLRQTIQKTIDACPQHRFLFLTKNPAAWPKWNPWPDNAWVGATAWDAESLIDAMVGMAGTLAAHKWLSIEPLLDRLNGGECEGERLAALKDAGIGWVVIGALTGPKRKLIDLQRYYPHLKLNKLGDKGSQYVLLPPIEWVKEIVQACDAAGVPIWLKENLFPLLDNCSSEDHDLYFSEMTQLRQWAPWYAETEGRE